MSERTFVQAMAEMVLVLSHNVNVGGVGSKHYVDKIAMEGVTESDLKAILERTQSPTVTAQNAWYRKGHTPPKNIKSLYGKVTRTVYVVKPVSEMTPEEAKQYHTELMAKFPEYFKAK